MKSKKIRFENRNGYQLSALLDVPLNQEVHAYAILAHVFTGSKNLIATKYISRCLIQHGIAVLRFDFTGLGESEGDFADTNFSSNVEDIIAASEYLELHYRAPELLVGHSLGGAAVIFAASKLEHVKAVATIGAPSEPEHVSHLLEEKIEQIEHSGKAKVNIGGRSFTIKKQFLDDLKSKDMYRILHELKKPILVMHSPQDTIVGIENAAEIYKAAFHPKSFVSLDGADHMLSTRNDAHYVGDLVASWLTRYVDKPKTEKIKTDKQVAARLGNDGYTTEVIAGDHSIIADESEDLGGEDMGPSPYQLLSSALASCKVMTMQMYARRKKWDLKECTVHIDYSRRYANDCANCEDKNAKIDFFDCLINLEGNLSDEQKLRLMEIAGKCPVHKTLQNTILISSRIA